VQTSAAANETVVTELEPTGTPATSSASPRSWAVAVGVLAHIYGGRGAPVAGFADCIVAVTAGALIFWHTNTNHRNTKDMRK
jgi:hypothetical protein